MIVDFSAVRLGKHPAAYHPAAAQFSAHKLASAPPPQFVQRGLTVPWGVDYNGGPQAIGDCTAVGIANYWRAVAALNGFKFDIQPDDTRRFYSASTGYVIGNPATDLGGNEAEVLTYQAQHGFIPASQMPLVGLPFDIAPDDITAVRNSIAKCAVTYSGFALPMNAQRQKVWDVSTEASLGDPAPASWGLHCADLWLYTGLDDMDLVTIVTWGIEQLATWRWIRKYADEHHGMMCRLLLDDQGRPPVGMDMDRLRADQPVNLPI